MEPVDSSLQPEDEAQEIIGEGDGENSDLTDYDKKLKALQEKLCKSFN